MKQYFTGFFTAVCLTASLFLFMGSQNKNLGAIEVESIVIKDETGATLIIPGAIQTRNTDGKETCFLGTGHAGDGIIKTFNNDGKETCYLGTGEGGGGLLAVSNKDEQVRIGLRISDKDDGRITLINNKGNKVVVMGALYSEKHNADGFIKLFDRYGDYGWGMTGKQ